jgi:hypothetical protein
MYVSCGAWQTRVNAYDNSQVHLFDGIVGYDLSVHANGHAYVSGGSISVLWTYHNSRVYISGGTIDGEIRIRL